MPAEVGDITIAAAGVGHVGMFIDPGTIMHAQNSGGVHTDKQVTTTANGGYQYFTNFAYRPPWTQLGAAVKTQRQAELVRVANRMKDRVPYGVWRAIRLFVGDSKFGPGAEARLKKYWERLSLIRGDAKTLLVTKVTCVEAVVLTYQLAFYQNRVQPFFINLDAAHTMPHSLETWLLANQWTRVAV
jgi:hypothetical protein